MWPEKGHDWLAKGEEYTDGTNDGMRVVKDRLGGEGRKTNRHQDDDKGRKGQRDGQSHEELVRSEPKVFPQWSDILPRLPVVSAKQQRVPLGASLCKMTPYTGSTTASSK